MTCIHIYTVLPVPTTTEKYQFLEEGNQNSQSIEGIQRLEKEDGNTKNEHEEKYTSSCVNSRGVITNNNINRNKK
eukprot:CAMPEP_0170874922 /NCGR_PEP_ID=MMETSP0734-20130129/28560_1 /TAXON_ID=186038 /ORGANISM="Fragilariopsis kerguelensis, Strain L26-C5" /LENGTH=74 /DNA_ID=CAMNT_0011256211 /DNA_START=74 /DNA_END=298 /DNA_ORIENTATION=-